MKPESEKSLPCNTDAERAVLRGALQKGKCFNPFTNETVDTDHLGIGERSTLLAAEKTKRQIGYPRKGGEHDVVRKNERADFQ